MRTTTTRLLGALLAGALVLTACGGDDTGTAAADTTGDPAGGAQGAEEAPADDAGGDPGGDAAIDPALFDAATCAELDGLDLEGVGTLMQLSASNNGEENLVCLYQNGEDATGASTRITLNGGATVADRALLANFDAPEGSVVEPVEGYGAAAILQDSMGLRAYFDGGLLVNVTVYTGETGDDGQQVVDTGASMAAAEALLPVIESHVAA